MTDRPVSFAIVGTGWRSEFFVRLAAALPHELRIALVVGRTPSSVDRLAKRWGVPVSTSISDLKAQSPEFVAVALPWEAAPVVTTELVRAGHHVLCETPPAPDLAGLRRLWDDLGRHAARVQVGEQYFRMPGHAARLEVVRAGTIGRPNSAEIASTHLYHAVSLMRSYLGVPIGVTTVNARQFSSPLIDPNQLGVWVENPAPVPRATSIATLDFGEGRYGLYNFVDNQWWNPLLHRRVVVRGALGELADDEVLYWRDGAPLASHIEYRRVGVDMSLEGNEVKTASFNGEVIYTNPCQGANLSEDDIAVAAHLMAQGRYVRGSTLR